MKMKYFSETDSLYIDLIATPSAESIEVSRDVIIDLDENGNIVGIDIQNATTHLDLNAIEMQIPFQALKRAVV